MSETDNLDIENHGNLINDGFNYYRVLARKYRPMVFNDLIGQEVLVTTLKNSFSQGRIAHAFLLHGVRGVGKTTAARIIARGLNCSAQENPTSEPCGACKNCKSAISERHMDIIEIDAASHTGVEDVRSLTDGIAYKPVLGRYRVYIIDEVHMLSISAFNALLKTLEEPPQHVKFIFCTTELKKIPVTVLSRCQRYDLKMIKTDDLINYFREIVSKEHMSIDEEALILIARASGGSLRDGLSILDQAIASMGKTKSISSVMVHSLLGSADREKILNLFDSIMEGKISLSLSLLESIFEVGAEPMAILEELLAIIHLISRLKIDSKKLTHYSVSENEYKRCMELSRNLSMSLLGRSWQILYKGLSEIRDLPNNREALEMVLIRLSYASDLPDPTKLIEKFNEQSNLKSEKKTHSTKGHNPVIDEINNTNDKPLINKKLQLVSSNHTSNQKEDEKEYTFPSDFKLFVDWLESHKEMQLHNDLHERIRVVAFKPGYMEVCKEDFLNDKFIRNLKNRMASVTNITWLISISDEKTLPTLLEHQNYENEKEKENALQNNKVREILESFPRSSIKEVRTKNKIQ